MKQTAEQGSDVVSLKFDLENPAFVDFGCGSGNSIRFAQSMMKAPGVGLDRSAAAVAACRAKGYEAHEADVLAFEQRSVAQTTFAIDLMPELPTRAAFERAFVNLVRAARDFSVIQHLCFDYDELRAARGAYVPANFAKSILYRPRIADYIHLASTHRRTLNIVGLAMFGASDVEATELGLPGLSTNLYAGQDQERPHRSLRIIIGRKDVSRFRNGLQRASTGDTLVIWEAES